MSIPSCSADASLAVGRTTATPPIVGKSEQHEQTLITSCSRGDTMVIARIL